MILKVKEPVGEELTQMREGQILFAYLHLAASAECAQAILDSKVTALAYETVTRGRALPLLAPMSQVAGRLPRWPVHTTSPSRRVAPVC